MSQYNESHIFGAFMMGVAFGLSALILIAALAVSLDRDDATCLAQPSSVSAALNVARTQADSAVIRLAMRHGCEVRP